MKKAFVSHSSKDEDMVHRLLTHIKVLENAGKLEVWHDSKIGAGKEWEKQINEQLDSSDIVILCVSADFMASDVVRNVELPKALSRHDSGKCIVIPVILKPCAWKEDHEIGRLQAVPRKGKPVSQYDDPDEAWREVIEAIAKAIESEPRRAAPSPSAKLREAQPKRSQRTLADNEANKVPMHAVITVHSTNAELAEVDILVLFPNHTRQRTKTDAQGQAHLSLHSGHLPMTVFAAAPGCAACIERNWVPKDRPLTLEVDPLPDGGAVIFPEYSGYLPGLKGRLNPVRDAHDRTYLYAPSISINDGQAEPVDFLPGDELHLEDANGNERWVRIIAIEGRSALVEYRLRPAAEK